MLVDFDVRGQQEMDFFTGEELWIMHCYLARYFALVMDLFHTNTQLLSARR